MSQDSTPDPLAGLMQQNEVLRALHAAGDEEAVVRILRAYVLGLLPSERRVFPKEMRLQELQSGDDVVDLAGEMTANALRGAEEDTPEGSIRPVRLVFTTACMRIVHIRKGIREN